MTKQKKTITYDVESYNGVLDIEQKTTDLPGTNIYKTLLNIYAITEKEALLPETKNILQSITQEVGITSIKEGLTQCLEKINTDKDKQKKGKIGRQLMHTSKNLTEILHQLTKTHNAQITTPEKIRLQEISQSCKINLNELQTFFLAPLEQRQQEKILYIVGPSVLEQIRHFIPDFFKKDRIVLSMQDSLKESHNHLFDPEIKILETNIKEYTSGSIYSPKDNEELQDIYTNHNTILLPSRSMLMKSYAGPHPEHVHITKTSPSKNRIETLYAEPSGKLGKISHQQIINRCLKGHSVYGGYPFVFSQDMPQAFFSRRFNQQTQQKEIYTMKLQDPDRQQKSIMTK